MILPTKHIPEERSLLAVGGRILLLLKREHTISSLWDEVKKSGEPHAGSLVVPFDWFVLALDLLFALGTVDLQHGVLRRRPQ